MADVVVDTNNGIRKNRVKTVINLNHIYFIQKGSCNIINRNEAVKVDDNSVLMMSKSNLLMSKKVNKEGIYTGLDLSFSNETLMDYIIKKGISLKEQTTNHWRLELVVKDRFLSRFENRITLPNKSRKHDVNHRKIDIEELLDHLKMKEPLKFSRFVKQALIEQEHFSFEEFVLNHKDHGLSIPHMAFLADMSLSTFKIKFFNTFQTTPRQYFISYKMNRALSLLKNNKKPTQIAALLGYDNLNAFSAAFKKAYGLSPRNYTKAYLTRTTTLKKVSDIEWN